jgi:hypothetical protein
VQGLDGLFLAHRAGDKNEGNVQLIGADQVQSLKSVKARHAVVGKHHIRREGVQHPLKDLGIRRQMQITLEPLLAE